jgi:hypothetical protein
VIDWDHLFTNRLYSFRILLLASQAISMATSSAMPAPGSLKFGIELTDLKSVQFENREIRKPHPNDTNRSRDGSDGRQGASKSTNIDRYNMERMGKQFTLPELALC